MNRKLYQLTSNEFVLPSTVIPNQPHKTKEAGNLPILKWPDGDICWPATLYLMEEYNRGKSRKGKGGSLATYAKQLSPIVRFCFKHQINFKDLNDSFITQFIQHLGNEKKWDTHGVYRHVRKSNQVLAIGRRTVLFLFWYQATFPHSGGLIGKGEDLCQITVYPDSQSGRNGNGFKHPSFPTKSVEKARIPVTTNQLEKLFIANLNSNQSVFIKRRRAAMLNLARATGMRRVEMSDVTVPGVKEAVDTGYLIIIPAKSKKKKVRQIPVLQSQLRPILSFIDGPRTKLMRNIGCKDTGYLFTTNRGTPLSEGTLTNDMHDLAQLADFEMNVCLHMFRHRYFTDMAYNLLLGIKEFAERRELTAPSERIVLQEMKNLSQHESEEALLGYIHAAYKEANALDSGAKLWKLSQIHESMALTIQELQASIISEEISASLACESLQRMLSDWGRDLNNCADQDVSLV
ncbi:tyrosine-type recombinase/integrase [Pseudomonadota bacterium]